MNPDDRTEDRYAEDVRLMSLVAAADPKATRVLAQRLALRVHRVSKSILRSDADADDAAQQSLIEILNSAGTYRGGSSVERWSDRVVVRTSMRFARSRQQHRLRIADDGELDAIPVTDDPGPPLSDAAPRPIQEYLGDLPETQRTALVLKHVMGYSVAEIAEITEASPNTVKDRLLRGSKEVRRLIRRDVAIGTADKGVS